MQMTDSHDRDQRGFTLIELMVVVLILGVLVAIALPVYLGARERASHRAAQSDLRNAISAAKIYFTDSETYTGFNAAGVASGIEPELDWQVVDGPSVQGRVTINFAGGDEVVMSTLSTAGDFFCIAGDAAGGVGVGGVIQGSIDATGAATTTDCNGPAW